MKDLGIKCLRLLEILSYIAVVFATVATWNSIFGIMNPKYWTLWGVLSPSTSLIVLSIVGALAVWYLVLKLVSILLRVVRESFAKSRSKEANA